MDPTTVNVMLVMREAVNNAMIRMSVPRGNFTDYSFKVPIVFQVQNYVLQTWNATIRRELMNVVVNSA